MHQAVQGAGTPVPSSRQENVDPELQLVIGRAGGQVRDVLPDMPDDPVRDGGGSDLVSEGFDPGVLDRVVLRAESQAEVDGRTAPLLVGMPEVRACLARPFL